MSALPPKADISIISMSLPTRLDMLCSLVCHFERTRAFQFLDGGTHRHRLARCHPAPLTEPSRGTATQIGEAALKLEQELGNLGRLAGVDRGTPWKETPLTQSGASPASVQSGSRRKVPFGAAFFAPASSACEYRPVSSSQRLKIVRKILCRDQPLIGTILRIAGDHVTRLR
jgi:hypothetical protein